MLTISNIKYKLYVARRKMACAIHHTPKYDSEGYSVDSDDSDYSDSYDDYSYTEPYHASEIGERKAATSQFCGFMVRNRSIEVKRLHPELSWWHPCHSYAYIMGKPMKWQHDKLASCKIFVTYSSKCMYGLRYSSEIDYCNDINCCRTEIKITATQKSNDGLVKYSTIYVLPRCIRLMIVESPYNSVLVMRCHPHYMCFPDGHYPYLCENLIEEQDWYINSLEEFARIAHIFSIHGMTHTCLNPNKKNMANAFVSGSHQRLGEHSPVVCLDQSLMRNIFVLAGFLKH
jgi:hypothetical protein